MKLYIAQSGESLQDIAVKLNVQYEELVRHNRVYRSKADLSGSPILVPESQARSSAPAMKVLRPFKTNRLEPLTDRLTNYEHSLKILILADFHLPAYAPALKKRLESYKADIGKILDAESRIKSTMKKKTAPYEDFDSCLDGLIQAIKKHGLDEVKASLRHLEDFPEKFCELFGKPNTRDSSLKDLLKKQAERWRDYILELAGREYEKAEELFSSILKEDLELAKRLLAETKKRDVEKDGEERDPAGD